ncbi:MAG: hypothetical protein ACM3MD_10220 [Betaproteobacteria bacterium]
MKHLLFILGLLFRRSKRVSDETDFLGFEVFTRPTGTNDDSTISSPDADKLIRKAA